MNELMGLNIFDIVVIALILLLSIKGLINGFTKELFGAIGLIGGIFVASYFNSVVADYIYTNITDAISIKVLKLISLVLIFVLFWSIISAIGKGISHLSSDDYISVASRLGGMLIKMVKLFFIFSLIVYAFSTKPQVQKDFKDTIESSKLFPILQKAGSSILNMAVSSSNLSSDSNQTTNINSDSNKTIKKDNSKDSNKSVELNSSRDKTDLNTKKEEVKKVESNTTATYSDSNLTDSNGTQHYR